MQNDKFHISRVCSEKSNTVFEYSNYMHITNMHDILFVSHNVCSVLNWLRYDYITMLLTRISLLLSITSFVSWPSFLSWPFESHRLLHSNVISQSVVVMSLILMSCSFKYDYKSCLCVNRFTILIRLDPVHKNNSWASS